MRLIARLLARLLALVLAAPLPAQSISFEIGGQTRNVTFTIPAGLDAPAPLVLVLHGVFEDGTRMRDEVTRQRFDTFADRFGFVVAYPSAHDGLWDIGEGQGAVNLNPRRDDIAFLDRVIDEAATRAPIDRRRVFAAGFSMGGMMSYSLACKRPGLIRAIATVAMPLPQVFADDCRAAPPAGVLLLHGTDDPIVPYAGGPIRSGLTAETELLSHDASLALFTARKGCAAPRETIYDARDDRTRVIRSTWDRCADGGAVEGYRIEGAGHRWPAGGPLFPGTLLVGPTTKEIEGAAAIWGFFSRFQ